MAVFKKKDSKTIAEIDRHRFLSVWTAIGVVLLFVGFLYVLGMFPTGLAVIAWTVIIVFCLREPVAFLERKGLHRILATTLSYVMLAVVLLFVGVLLFSPNIGIAGQFADLIAAIPEYFQYVVSWVGDLYDKYSNLFNDAEVRKWLVDVAASMAEALSNVASESASGLVAFGTGLVNSIIVIVFSLIIAFWILMSLPAIGREVWRICGTEREEELRMLHLTFTRVMGGYIKATLLQCTICGVACGLFFVLIGLPSAAALGFLCFLLNIIPIVGGWIGSFLFACVGLVVSPLTAVIAFLGSIFIQKTVTTFVSPKLMQNSVDIHPAAVLLVLLVGSGIGEALGGLMGSLVGALISIPAIAVIKSLFVYYFEKNTGRRIVAEDGVFFKGEAETDAAFDPLADAIAPGRRVREDEEFNILEALFTEKASNVAGSTEENAAAAHHADAAASQNSPDEGAQNKCANTTEQKER